MRHVGRGRKKDSRIVTEGLWHRPHRLRSRPPIDEHPFRELVHARADVLKLTLTIVAAAVSVVLGAWCPTQSNTLELGSTLRRKRMKERPAYPHWLENVTLLPIMYVSCMSISAPEL